MLNSIILLGRLTKDPELRKTNSDKSVTNFTLAVDNPVTEPDGTRNSFFIDVRVFGTLAENVVKYTHKGSKVAVTGKVNQRNFERRDGSRGSVIEIIADAVEFLEPLQQPHPTEEELQAELAVANLPEDDLPFKEEETKPQENSQSVKEKPQAKYNPFTGKPLKPTTKK